MRVFATLYAFCYRRFDYIEHQHIEQTLYRLASRRRFIADAIAV